VQKESRLSCRGEKRNGKGPEGGTHETFLQKEGGDVEPRQTTKNLRAFRGQRGRLELSAIGAERGPLTKRKGGNCERTKGKKQFGKEGGSLSEGKFDVVSV